jgi:hypothetical protein
MVNEQRTIPADYSRKHIEDVKVKESRNRPSLTQRFPGVLGSQIS